MAIIAVAGRKFTIDLIIFDKDGTLIEFEQMWGARTRRCVKLLLNHIDADADLSNSLCRTLGYDSKQQRVLAGSPMAMLTRGKLALIAATVLYQHGYDWHVAEDHAVRVFNEIMTAPPSAAELKATADLPALFTELHQVGVKTAILTSDDQRPTVTTMRLLGIESHIDGMVCGDSGFPSKPDPTGLLDIVKTLAVTPQRTMMIGDSSADILAGVNAGVACSLGVLTGTSDRVLLEKIADAVTDSIADLSIVN